MINHICDNCIHKVEPTSIRDFYVKTYKMPDMKHWGESDFKHFYWLCKSQNIAKVDGVNGVIIHKLCIDYNKHSNCTYFRSENAEDILPSAVEIIASKNEVEIDDDLELSVRITPYTIPATEDKEEFVNKQEINYSYIWYKNGRKLFKKRSNILKVDTKNESIDEYYCIVEQTIKNNGDGGKKEIEVETNKIIITVNAKSEI